MVHFQAKQLDLAKKNWVLCSDDSYPFNVAPYQGKAVGEGNSPIGPKVMTSLLGMVDAPNIVDADNFFTSPNLLLQLRGKGFKATGTVTVNRLKGTSLKGTKQMEKMDKGSMGTIRWSLFYQIIRTMNHCKHVNAMIEGKKIE